MKVLFVLCLLAVVVRSEECADGSQPVNCFVAPCQTYDGCKLGCVNDYCGGCNHLCVCNSDADCPADAEFCRPTRNATVSVCVAYSGEGSPCGGRTFSWAQTRCAPGLDCLTTVGPVGGDVPGVCHRPCASHADCAAGQRCLGAHCVVKHKHS